MGDPEVEVGGGLALEFPHGLPGPGQLGCQPGPLRGSEAFGGLPQRSLPFGGALRLATELTPLTEPGMLGSGQT